MTWSRADATARPHRSFARHLRAEDKAARTVIIYGQAIDFFSNWLEAQGRQPVLEELSRAAITECLAELNESKEPSTVKTRYRGLYRFCKWLVDEGELTEHPMKNLSPPSPAMKLVPIISEDQLAALVKPAMARTSTTAAMRPWSACCSPAACAYPSCAP